MPNTPLKRQGPQRRKTTGKQLISQPKTPFPRKILPKPVYDFVYTKKTAAQIAKEHGFKRSAKVISWATNLASKGLLSKSQVDKAKKKTHMTAKISTGVKFKQFEWQGSIELKRGHEPKERKRPEQKPYDPRMKLHPALYDLLYTKEPVTKLAVKHGFNTAKDLLTFAQNQALKHLDKKK